MPYTCASAGLAAQTSATKRPAARDRFTGTPFFFGPHRARDIVLDPMWSVERKLPAGAAEVKRKRRVACPERVKSRCFASACAGGGRRETHTAHEAPERLRRRVDVSRRGGRRERRRAGRGAGERGGRGGPLAGPRLGGAGASRRPRRAVAMG